MGDGTELDYETQTTYEVTVMAEDSFGASATIMVTITVTDVDEVPDVSGDAAIEYAENGTSQVARYTAVDPEQTAIVSWSLAGDEASLFSIEGGVLKFKKSPDFEMAADTGTDNMYSVTVQATDETNKVGMKEVMVEVTNVDEPGKVTLSALQPQSATVLTAMHTDPDGTISDLKWQWARSGRKNSSYTDIEDAIASTYEPDDDDGGYYLRATASYTDAEGFGQERDGKIGQCGAAGAGREQGPCVPVDDDTAEINEGAPTRTVAENTKAGMADGHTPGGQCSTREQ